MTKISMIRRLTLFFVFVCYSLVAIAQQLPLPAQPLWAGWQRIMIPSVGYIDISSNMEVQSQNMQGSNRYFGSGSQDYIAVYSKGKSAESVRLAEDNKLLMVRTFSSDLGLSSFRADLDRYITPNDVKEFSEGMRHTLESSMAQDGIRILKWTPIKLYKVNGMWYFANYLIQKSANQSERVLYTYWFFNGSREHALAISYRINEANLWKADLDRVVSSFRITEIE